MQSLQQQCIHTLSSVTCHCKDTADHPAICSGADSASWSFTVADASNLHDENMTNVICAILLLLRLLYYFAMFIFILFSSCTSSHASCFGCDSGCCGKTLLFQRSWAAATRASILLGHLWRTMSRSRSLPSPRPWQRTECCVVCSLIQLDFGSFSSSSGVLSNDSRVCCQ